MAPQMRLCECGGLPRVHTLRVAEDAVETWVQCNRCPIRTDEIEDAYPDYGTAEWQWNRGDVRAARALSDTPPETENGDAR